jgi:hypothetical protein
MKLGSYDVWLCNIRRCGDGADLVIPENPVPHNCPCLHDSYSVEPARYQALGRGDVGPPSQPGTLPPRSPVQTVTPQACLEAGS